MALQKRKATTADSLPAKAARARVQHLDWDLVRVFLGVSRSGTMSTAAQRLGMDVSTVSRRLERLEKDLGIVVFERNREGVIATEAGEKLLPAAEEMARAMGDLGVALDAAEADVEGVVRLTAPPGIADVFVASALPRFQSLHPRVRVDLDVSIGYADLTRGEADLALRVRRPESGDLTCKRLASARSLPSGSAAYVGSIGRLRRMADARWIGWGHDLANVGEARWLTRYLAVPPVLRTSSFSAQLHAAAAGVGLMLAPEPFVRRLGLVPLTHGPALLGAWDALPTTDLWLIGHVALCRVPRVAALRDFLLGELGRDLQTS